MRFNSVKEYDEYVKKEETKKKAAATKAANKEIGPKPKKMEQS